MPAIVDLQIADEDADHPPPSQINLWINTALAQVPTEFPDDIELTVRFVDRQEITELNSQYRDKQKATNVLSFPADLPEHIPLSLLGDVVICSDVVQDEAKEQQKPIEHHFAHIVIHGTLHLIGYDHEEDEEAEVMEALEIAVLNELGIKNPYQGLTHPLPVAH